jgi:stage V sporulation protein B
VTEPTPALRTPESIPRGAVLITVASAVFVISGYAVNVWLGRLLGPEDYGRFGVVIALITVLNVVQNAAIPQAVARFVAANSEPPEGILRLGAELQIGVALVLTACLVIAAPWISTLLGDDNLVYPLRVIALVLPAYGIFTLLMAFDNGRRAYTRQAVTQGTYAVAKAIASIGLSYPLQLLGAVIGYVVAPLVAIVVGWQRLWAPRATLGYRSLLGFAGPLSVYALASVGQLNFDILFVKAMVPGTGAAGFYAASQNISRIPYFLLTGLAVILLPAVAAAVTRGGEAVRSTSREALRAAVLLVVPPAALIVATSARLVELVYSESYAPGAGALSILAIGMGAVALSTVVASVVNGIGRAGATAAVTVGGTALTVVLCPILIPPFGATGAALATTAGGTVSLVILTLLATSSIPHLIPLASVARICAASGIVGVAAWLVPASGFWLVLEYLAAGLAGAALLVMGGELTERDLRTTLASLRRPTVR